MPEKAHSIITVPGIGISFKFRLLITVKSIQIPSVQVCKCPNTEFVLACIFPHLDTFRVCQYSV